jgi:predicted small lipoprotein YifL
LQGNWYTIWRDLVNTDTRKGAMRNPFGSIILLMLTFVFLSACGQKGPLFLPGNPSSLQSIPSAEELQQLPEEDDDDKDEDEEDPAINRQ